MDPAELIELQRSFFGLIAQAEQAKLERIEAKRRYEEKLRTFEEARRILFEVAEFLDKEQQPGHPSPCNWVEVASARLQAID